MAGYHDGRNTFYVGEFDGQMEEGLIIPLTLAVKQQANITDGRIDMFINSYGGNAHLCQHVVELMEMAKREGVVVRTIVTGAAFSAGSVVAVAGTQGERYIAKEAQHLAHYGQVSSGEDTTPLQAKRNHAAKQVFFKQMVKHYKTYCDIPNLEDNLLEDDWYISALQARRWGMADHYIDKYELLW